MLDPGGVGDERARTPGHDGASTGRLRLLELLAGGGSLPEVLEALAREVERGVANGLRASILLLDPDERRLRRGAAPTLPAAYNEAIDGPRSARPPAPARPTRSSSASTTLRLPAAR